MPVPFRVRAPTLLLIGIGNPDCGDDGAGVEVVRRVAAASDGIGTLTLSGGAAELIDAWSGTDRVVVVDAARSGRPPGTVSRFEADAEPLPAGHERRSTHGLGLAEAIELARNLGLLPSRLTVYAIEAAETAVGSVMTPAVARAVERLADELADVERLRRAGIEPVSK